MKHLYVPCTCHTSYHHLAIMADDDDPSELYVQFASTRNGSFFHRLKWAMKHVFGSQDLCFADIIIKREDLIEALSKED